MLHKSWPELLLTSAVWGNKQASKQTRKSFYMLISLARLAAARWRSPRSGRRSGRVASTRLVSVIGLLWFAWVSFSLIWFDLMKTLGSYSSFEWAHRARPSRCSNKLSGKRDHLAGLLDLSRCKPDEQTNKQPGEGQLHKSNGRCVFHFLTIGQTVQRVLCARATRITYFKWHFGVLFIGKVVDLSCFGCHCWPCAR